RPARERTDRAHQEHHGGGHHRCGRGRLADEGNDRERGTDSAHRRGLRLRVRGTDPAHRPDPQLAEQAPGGEAMTSVLYDAPGPRSKRRNVILAVVFVAVLALALWWIYKTMDDKGQLEWSLWKPFTQSEAWTTYLLPGLADTLKAAALSR